MREKTSLWRRESGSALGVSRQTVVGKLLPGRPRVDEDVVLRPDFGVVVECSQTHADDWTVGPLTAAEGRPAGPAEHDRRAAFCWRVRAERIAARQQPRAAGRHPTVEAGQAAGQLSAPRAVAVAGAFERRCDLVGDRAT